MHHEIDLLKASLACSSRRSYIATGIFYFFVFCSLGPYHIPFSSPCSLRRTSYYTH